MEGGIIHSKGRGSAGGGWTFLVVACATVWGTKKVTPLGANDKIMPLFFLAPHDNFFSPFKRFNYTSDCHERSLPELGVAVAVMVVGWGPFRRRRPDKDISS